MKKKDIKKQARYKVRNLPFFETYWEEKEQVIKYTCTFWTYDKTTKDMVKRALGFKINPKTCSIEILDGGLKSLLRSYIHALFESKFNMDMHDDTPESKWKLWRKRRTKFRDNTIQSNKDDLR